MVDECSSNPERTAVREGRAYQGGLIPAQHASQEAIRLHQEIANRRELARNYTSYTSVSQAGGESDRAKEHLGHALMLFRHLGRAWNLVQAAQALEQSLLR